MEEKATEKKDFEENSFEEDSFEEDSFEEDSLEKEFLKKDSRGSCSDRITSELLDKYEALSREAFEKAKSAIDESTPERAENARDFLNMARCYIEDASHFRKKGNLVRAYGALNYAHGWLDAGARIKLFNVHDSRLFTVDEE